LKSLERGERGEHEKSWKMVNGGLAVGLAVNIDKITLHSKVVFSAVLVEVITACSSLLIIVLHTFID
jgi:hypothetical protein